MKYNLEQLKMENVIHNTYVDMESLLSKSENAKKRLSRTRSEPVYHSKEIFATTNQGLQSGEKGDSAQIFRSSDEGCRAASDRPQFFSRRLSPVPCEDALRGMVVHVDVTHMTTHQSSPKQHGSSRNPLVNRKTLHRRYSSVTEGDLSRYHSAGIKAKVCGRPASNQLIFKNSASVNEAIHVDRCAEAITRQPVGNERIICQQPAKYTEFRSCSFELQKDNCYRCLRKCRDVVRCCTCLWCLDAACYHCYKDDVGYSNWHDDMLTCSDQGAVAKNCKKWSLLGLATLALPCLLFYPILGGGVELCMKRRLKKSDWDN